uniref:CRISPR-associated endonuclease Cas1 n=1 Tax=candidate division CPR3 bacterium TaxID=2268181 RepID=A0A7V3N5B2_UNCC3
MSASLAKEVQKGLRQSQDLFSLQWHRLRCTFINTRSVPGKTLHTFIVFQAIVKLITSLMQENSPNEVQPDVIFHIVDKGFAFKAREGDSFSVDFLFFRAPQEWVEEWCATLADYFASSRPGINYQIIDISAPEERTLSQLITESPIMKQEGELCLKFLTPIPFKRQKGWNRTYLSTETFIKILEQRFSRLFHKEITYKGKRDAFSILPYYWKYTEIRRSSMSQPGTIQYINGCFGPLYLKGAFTEFLPFLILGSEIHAGTKLSYSQGYYKLLEDSPPYFAKFFPNKKSLLSVIAFVKERDDSLLTSLEEAEDLITNEEDFADRLVAELQNDTYVPSSSTAFSIPKREGGERVIERLTLKDLIVSQYLLKTISEAFDRFFEESSIGYRKGISRQKAVELIEQAIQDGFQFVVEADISDFFPSIDHDLLFALLDAYIPESDHLLNTLLRKCIKRNYLFNGRLHERIRGLCQGDPLSPILANLYLDSFDEQIEQENVRLIRYADDFIILTRTREEAQRIFSKAQSFLAGLGLTLHREKTHISAISEGFQFLGITFRGSEAQVAPEEEIKRFKKPLYIAEPYLFLSLNGEAIDVLRKGKPVETIPLRRVSEIIIMEKASFSTGLLTKCVQENIPITITLGSGYFITTIKPDSKFYYTLASEHARKYSELTPTEILTIAKEFAGIKIQNAITLFRQKYKNGMHQLIAELEEMASRIYQAPSIEEVRGMEGASARKIYKALNLLIDDSRFHLKKRERARPDRINSLLNFGYYLLYSRINATLRAVGLNPYLGFLHAPQDTYESLVADIQELFRARIDRFVIRLVNLGIISAEEFIETEKGAYLVPDAKKKFLAQFERELIKPSASPKDRLCLLDWIYYQIVVFKKWVCEEGSLIFYRWER